MKKARDTAGNRVIWPLPAHSLYWDVSGCRKGQQKADLHCSGELHDSQRERDGKLRSTTDAVVVRLQNQTK